jgi:Fibronectin type III domain
MNITSRVRRAVVVAALASTIAGAVGAAGAAQADDSVAADPPPVEVPPAPTDESPPGSTAGETASEPTPPTPGEDPSTSNPTPPAPPEPTVTPTTTIPPLAPEPPTATEPPVATQPPPAPPKTTQPHDAIATTTTPGAVPVTVAAMAATAPQSPVATPGNRTIKLTWKAPASNGGATIDKYAVQRFSNGQWTNVAFPTGLGYTVSNLANGTKYSFRIRAHNAAGWSPVSTVVSAVPRTVPSAPRSPVATAGNASVKLTWLAPASNGGATVQRYAVQSYISGKWTNVAFPTGRGYTVANLVNGTKYSFRIRAFNAAGWSPVSTVVNATPHAVAPGAPTSLVATPGNGSISLTWKAPASNGGETIDKYAVQRFSNGQWTNVAFPTGFGYTVSNLANGTKYSFRIRAQNAAGWSPVSTVVSAVTFTTPSMPQSCVAGQMWGPGTHILRTKWLTPTSDGGAPILLYRVEFWVGPKLYDVNLVGPTANDWFHHQAWVPTFPPPDFWLIKVFALNEVSQVVGPNEPQTEGAYCIATAYMLP